MKRAWTTLLAVAALACLFAADPPAAKSHKLTSVSMRKMADALHAVLLADRDAYLVNVVEPAGTNAAGLPAHARLQRFAAGNIQQRGAEFSYTLRSPWPMQEKNAPQTQVETDALQQLLKDPAQTVYQEEELGGRSYFTAIYADRATRASCVQCHNASRHSPRHDFKEGDVMGAVVVRIPLEF